MTDAVALIRRAARDVRALFVPDPRVDLFDVCTHWDGAHISVQVTTTVPAAEAEFRTRLEAAGVDTDLRVRMLPPRAARRSEALVRAAIAPVYRRPTMNSAQLTQYVMGSPLTLLSRQGRFWCIRGEDRHVGWVHSGFLAPRETIRAFAREHTLAGRLLVSLGAVVVDDAGRPFARLPWGARVVRQDSGHVMLPDGRRGRIGAGEVMAADRISEYFPPRGENLARTARRWLGAPYLWGGVTPWGVDCSGFVQSLFRLHGIALPRDSDMQAKLGASVEAGAAWQDLRPGDLLFFAERRRVNHVAISMGGPGIVHASASNGGVHLNDMTGELPVEAFLRGVFHSARRLMLDPGS